MVSAVHKSYTPLGKLISTLDDNFNMTLKCIYTLQDKTAVMIQPTVQLRQEVEVRKIPSFENST